MKSLFKSANVYLSKSDWKDLAIIKFCLFSIGLLLGSFLPEEKKPSARLAAVLVFLCTYLPLMTKYYIIIKDTLEQE